MDYVKSVDSAMCGKTLYLSLEQVFGRSKSLSVHRSTSMLTGKFSCTNISYPHRKLLF